MIEEIKEEIVNKIVRKAKDKVAENSKLIKPERDQDLVDYFHIMIEKEVQNAD